MIRAAEAGKHVVCEKPCAPTLPDLRDMVQACDRNGVQFMDGVMFVHSLAHGRDARCAGRWDERGTDPAGSICLRLLRSPGILFRQHTVPQHPHGAPVGRLGDLAWGSCIRFSLWALGWRMPVEVTGRLLSQFGRKDDTASIPTGFSAELLYEDGLSAGFFCSFTAENSNT